MNTIDPKNPRTWKIYILTRDVTNPEGDGRISSWSRRHTWKAGEKVITRDGKRVLPWGLRHERGVPLEVFEDSLRESTAREQLDSYLILYDLTPDNIIDQMLSQGKISMSDIKDACIERARIHARQEAEDMQKIIASVRARNLDQQATKQAKQDEVKRPETPRKCTVLFSFTCQIGSLQNIAHVTLDGKKTLCGRTGWVVEHGWQEPPIVDCAICNRVLRKTHGGSSRG